MKGLGTQETRYWTWHMAAGVAMLLLLGMHMISIHLGGLTGIYVADRAADAASLANSQARDASLFLTVIYILLLGLALYHGFYGLRTILFELTLRPATERAVTVTLVVVGLGLFGFGTWAMLAAHQAALAKAAHQGALMNATLAGTL
jgi:succinate dehydrogenase/fumarate reductase cytochrome b subunit